MTGQSAGDQAQIRTIAEQLVDAAYVKVKAEEARDSLQLTPAVKWFAGIMSALIAAFGIWSVKTLNEVQLSVAEIKTQLGQSGAIEIRLQNLERRTTTLEKYHQGAPQ